MPLYRRDPLLGTTAKRTESGCKKEGELNIKGMLLPYYGGDYKRDAYS